MNRQRVSTTVDGELLSEARALRKGDNDAKLFDEALSALLNRNRSAQIDATYSVYGQIPLDELDDWGSLAAFRDAAGAQ